MYMVVCLKALSKLIQHYRCTSIILHESYNKLQRKLSSIKCSYNVHVCSEASYIKMVITTMRCNTINT